MAARGRACQWLGVAFAPAGLAWIASTGRADAVFRGLASARCAAIGAALVAQAGAAAPRVFMGRRLSGRGLGQPGLLRALRRRAGKAPSMSAFDRRGSVCRAGREPGAGGGALAARARDFCRADGPALRGEIRAEEASGG